MTVTFGFEDSYDESASERVIERRVITQSEESELSVKKPEERHIVIQFDTDDIVALPDSEPQLNSFFEKNKEHLDGGLHGIHFAFLVTSWFVVLVYLLNTLYSDRKDRSILFWKSMPVSETQVVVTKLLVGLIAVPLIATLVSWDVQLVYAVMAMMVASSMNLDPWQVILPNLHIASAFVRQLGLVFYISVWALPICAWLLFASAFAKRSPFLTAILPLVGVAILEGLLFRSSHFGEWMASHTPFADGSVDALVSSGGIQMANPGDILLGLAIGAGLLVAAVWLRNNRFEM